jgi:hypothetical protein
MTMTMMMMMMMTTTTTTTTMMMMMIFDALQAPRVLVEVESHPHLQMEGKSMTLAQRSNPYGRN